MNLRNKILKYKLVLMFHNIRNKPLTKYDVSWKKFKLILYIINKFINYKKINNRILFTFDDGYYSQIIAARYLSLYFRYKSIIFISTNHIGKPGFISARDIKRQKSKYINFGSHGHKHISLKKDISRKKIINELLVSKQILNKLHKKKIIYLSFPNGLYSEISLSEANKLGYKYIFTSRRASNRKLAKDNTINRFVVLKNTSIFILIIAYFGILDNFQDIKKRIYA